MPDQVTEVTKTGWGSRLGSSFKGIFIGIILFLVSFGVLYWNEGRVDMSDVAGEAVEISATQQNTNPELEGKLVSMTGVFDTEEILGDGMYLSAGEYISVNRIVEMFAWEETSSSKTEKQVGGSQTTETTYSYAKGWTTSPEDSNGFHEPNGHFNPDKWIEDYSEQVVHGTVGVYNVEPQKMQLPIATLLALTDENIETDLLSKDIFENTPSQQATSTGYDAMQKQLTNGAAAGSLKTVKEGNYIFMGNGSLTNPEVGDLRIRYEVITPGKEVTLFGKLNGSSVISFTDKDDNTIYRALTGTREEALATMHGEYTTMLWIFRIVGFLMMWIGLGMVLEPLSTLLDVLPFLGSVSRSVVGFVTFLVALVLSAVTILISMILHSLLALVLTVVVVCVVVFLLMKKKDAQTSTPSSNS